MTWSVLAGATAVVYALHGAWSKRVARRSGSLVAGWALFFFAIPFLALALGLRGVPDVGPRFWTTVAVNCVLHLGAIVLFFSALRAGDLGVVYPLLALTPLFVVPVEWVLLGELPRTWGLVGIGVVVLGIYLLHFGERNRGVLGPLRALARNPGARRSLAVAAVWSVTGTLDRVAVLEASPAFYGVVLSSCLALLYVPVLLWDARRAAAGFGARLRSAGGPALLLHGFLYAAMLLLQMEALEVALASYVLSVKRTGAILAVVFGFLAFREEGLRQRLAGTVVTIAGVTVLVVWG